MVESCQIELHSSKYRKWKTHLVIILAKSSKIFKISNFSADHFHRFLPPPQCNCAMAWHEQQIKGSCITRVTLYQRLCKKLPSWSFALGLIKLSSVKLIYLASLWITFKNLDKSSSSQVYVSWFFCHLECVQDNKVWLFTQNITYIKISIIF